MSSLTFSLVTPDLLTSAATFAPGDGHLLSSNYSLGTQVNSITIVPNGLSLGGSSYDLVRFTYTLYNGSTGSDTYPFYSPNAFGTYGTHTFQAGVLSGTLAVSPTPEPSALAALGLGAVALVKRRRRA